MCCTYAGISETFISAKKYVNPFLGFIYTIMTSVFMLLSFVCMKKLSYISPSQLALIRNVVFFVGSFPVATYSVKEVLGMKEERILLISRGFFAGICLYLHTTAFKYLPFGDVSIIISSVPAAINIIARIYLKEPCGLIQIISVILTITGVLLSAHIPEILRQRSNIQINLDYFFGVISAILCVFFLATTYVLIRRTKDVHFSVCLLYVGIIGAFVNAFINMFSYYTLPYCGWDIIYLIMTGVFSFIGQYFLHLAVQTELVGIVAVLKASLDVIVSIGFQIIFFTSVPDLYNLSGACFVIVSLSMIGMHKYILSLPESSRRRRKFKLILL